MTYNALQVLTACALIFLTACASTPMPREGDLYINFTLLDPKTEARTTDAWMLVADGEIVRTGHGRPPRVESTRMHDMGGAFALPGFIDTHAHVTLGRIAVRHEGDTPVIVSISEAEITAHNARLLLAHGVTTIRNPGGSTEMNRAYNDAVRDGALLGPEQLAAGEILDTSRIDGLTLVVATPAEIEAAVANQAAAGMNYIKLYQGLSEDLIRAGVESAHRHGLRAITHNGAISWTRAAELGVDGIVHAMPNSADTLTEAAREGYRGAEVVSSHAFYTWWERVDLDSPQVRELIDTLAARHVTVDLTLVVFQKTFWGDDEAVRDDGIEFTHPAMRENWRTFRFDAGWTPEQHARARAIWPKIQRFARMLHEAGVQLTIGTDLANPFVAPGYDTLTEMELHRDAGIPAWAVLRAATSDAAETMGLERRIGRLARGMEADVVFLSADPSQDIANVRSTRAVLLNGARYDAASLRAMPIACSSERASRSDASSSSRAKCPLTP
ncbi:MAG: amidohydrolase family protein [Caulobacterales bacterium]|nr:amidohydrolase family protein [Caulobacterales bacterium]